MSNQAETKPEAPPVTGTLRNVRLALTSGQFVDIEVVVGESRKNFGRVDWQVTPVAGDGELWVRETTFLSA